MALHNYNNTCFLYFTKNSFLDSP